MARETSGEMLNAITGDFVYGSFEKYIRYIRSLFYCFYRLFGPARLKRNKTAYLASST
jgi:hypothetical protein